MTQSRPLIGCRWGFSEVRALTAETAMAFCSDTDPLHGVTSMARHGPVSFTITAKCRCYL